MKAFMIEEFVKMENGKESHNVYECNGYEHQEVRSATGKMMNQIMMEDANSYKVGKSGKVVKKQFSRRKAVFTTLGGYQVIETTVYVWENGTDNIVEKFEA